MRRQSLRCGAVTLEAAIVYPVLLLLLFGLVVGGLMVFRYQQVALVAQETARYASVRGAAWARDTMKTSPSAATIREQVVLPLVPGVAPEDVTVRIEWIDKTTGQALEWDASSKEPSTDVINVGIVTNEVRVSVGVKWSPRMVIRSVAVVPMGY